MGLLQRGKMSCHKPRKWQRRETLKRVAVKVLKLKIAFGSFTCRLLGNFTASVKGTYSKSKAEGISSNNAKEKVR